MNRGIDEKFVLIRGALLNGALFLCLGNEPLQQLIQAIRPDHKFIRFEFVHAIIEVSTGGFGSVEIPPDSAQLHSLKKDEETGSDLVVLKNGKTRH